MSKSLHREPMTNYQTTPLLKEKTCFTPMFIVISYSFDLLIWNYFYIPKLFSVLFYCTFTFPFLTKPSQFTYHQKKQTKTLQQLVTSHTPVFQPPGVARRLGASFWYKTSVSWEVWREGSLAGWVGWEPFPPVMLLLIVVFCLFLVAWREGRKEGMWVNQTIWRCRLEMEN